MSLGLARQNLSDIPADVFVKATLTKLDLSFNQLTTLSGEIGRLTKLRDLNLRTNLLTNLPAEIGQLNNLTRLNLWGNQLRTLPREIGRLTKLINLNLGMNRLTTLPREIGQLTNLQFLGLDGNRLTTLPTEIGRLSTNLEYLYLKDNRLTTLPKEFGKLTNLENLSLEGNPLILRNLPNKILQPHITDIVDISSALRAEKERRDREKQNLVERNVNSYMSGRLPRGDPIPIGREPVDYLTILRDQLCSDMTTELKLPELKGYGKALNIINYQTKNKGELCSEIASVLLTKRFSSTGLRYRAT